MTTPTAAAFYLNEHIGKTGHGEAVVFNPAGVSEDALTKIFCFSATSDGGNGMAYAMTERGKVINSWYCSNEIYAVYDLGVTTTGRKECHAHYEEHCPEGYKMVFIPASELQTHPEFQKAWALNQAQPEPEA